MTRIAIVAIAATIALTAGPARAEEPAPTEAEAILRARDGADLDDVLARLRGHRVTVDAERRWLRIDDIAGEGPPRVGVVERRGERLWLITSGGALVLEGALARPRIAGPGYTVWAIGERRGNALRLRRIGVLRRP